MRFAGSYCLAAAVMLFSARAWSQDGGSAASSDTASVDTANKPYATIVARNIFGLLPVPPPDTNPPAPPVDPPPKITLNGIMTIFGKNQALYKVAVKSKPGHQATEDSHVLAEGEREDDVEVIKIDVDNRMVTFNNHGTVQDVPLEDSKSAETAANSGGGGGPGGFSPNGRPGMMTPADRASFMRDRQMGRSTPNPGNPGSPSFNSGSTFGQQNNGFAGAGYQQPAAPLSDSDIEDRVVSAAQQMAQMELNRISTQQQVDQGALPPLPPTPLTPKDATGIGGSPLTIPSLPPMPGR